MSDPLTRRHFLKITAAAGATATLAADAAAASPAPLGFQKPTQGTIHVRVTDKNRKFTAAPSLAWVPGAASADVVALDPSRQFQTHLGIGGAFTDAACYTLHRLSDGAREWLFHEMFHPSEMGLGVGRICMGSSDYSTKLYSYDEGEPDPDLQRFSIEHDRAWILPILRQARAANPDLWLLASPWSPPGWMKPNGSMLGGCMHPKSMESYANYFLKFLKAYEQEGVPINSVTSQNEVDTEQDGRMPACAWPQEYEISFVSRFLGPLLRRHGSNTKICLLDHNYNLWGRVVCMLENPAVRQYANAVAWHGYVGTPDMMARVQDAYPGIEMFWTEGGPDITQPDYATDWSHWGETFTGILRNGCRCVIGWNLALDEQGKPNIGPFACGGTVTIDSKTNKITRSGQFWAMNHFARSVRPRGRRFQSQSALAGLGHVAFENAGGQRALVLTNPGKQRNVQIELAGMRATVSLSADSITTLSWT
jgi:glucosylceramidase